ncbi:hypothetical protein ACFQH5_19125 [Halomonas salifodinae]|uniref:Tripartite tricarboxylate transporter TctB family protein n=1 Tax=Halomonas salifodinae TaxID=438745 RepID=A0ABW2F6J1_9GAMM
MTQRLREELLFILVIAAAMVTALALSAEFPFIARLMPQVVAISALILLAVELINTWRRRSATMAGGPVWGSKLRRTAPYFAWLAALYTGIALVGMLSAALLFTFLFAWRVGGMRWWVAALGAAALIVALMGFGEAFNLRWPEGFFLDPYR